MLSTSKPSVPESDLHLDGLLIAMLLALCGALLLGALLLG